MTGAQRTQHSHFAQAASKIGIAIHSTTQKLHRLSQLAKRTSMFDDPAEEIAQLTNIIKQDVQAINNDIAQLQNLSAVSRDGNKQTLNHSHTVVDSLRTRLKDTTKEFKDVLTIRQQNLQQNQGRKGFYSNTKDPPLSAGSPGQCPRVLCGLAAS